MTEFPPSAPVPRTDDRPPRRRWFVVLAWITLVGFGIFTAAITVFAVFLREFGQARGR